MIQRTFFSYRLKEYTRSIKKLKSAMVFLYQMKRLFRHLHFTKEICFFLSAEASAVFSSQMIHSIQIGSAFSSCLQPFIMICPFQLVKASEFSIVLQRYVGTLTVAATCD